MNPQIIIDAAIAAGFSTVCKAHKERGGVWIAKDRLDGWMAVVTVERGKVVSVRRHGVREV